MNANPDQLKQRVPSIKGLNQQDAETKLRASNLNIRLLATRYDLPLQPGLIIDQSPQSGEEVNYGSAVNVVVSGGSQTFGRKRTSR